MLVSVPWAFSLSALSLRGIKLYTWNALTVGHQHVSTWPETQVPVRLYPDARNSSSQQEQAHGHAAWEISFPTRVFFTFDYNDLKGFSTASTTVQGVKSVVLSGTRPSALLVLSAPAAGRRRLEPRSALFPPWLGRDQSEEEVRFTPLQSWYRWCTGVSHKKPLKASWSSVCTS